MLPWLERYRPELLAPGEAESLRAVRIAVHVGRKRLGAIVRGGQGDPAAQERFSSAALPAVDRAVRARAQYSSRLVGLRVHHELTRLHCDEYVRLLRDLLGEGPCSGVTT